MPLFQGCKKVSLVIAGRVVCGTAGMAAQWQRVEKTLQGKDMSLWYRKLSQVIGQDDESIYTERRVRIQGLFQSPKWF